MRSVRLRVTLLNLFAKIVTDQLKRSFHPDGAIVGRQS